ncbi:MAG: HAD family hydrolase [Bryobacterales bacterium]|nr:HAD family hydrolase [Bryobacterales bacterium]
MGIDAVRRAVFLDRDGVLNHAVLVNGRPYPPRNAEDLRMVEDAAVELARLKKRGYLLIVVTNQPDVARGSQLRSEVEAMNAKIAAAMPIDDFFVCYHDDLDNCGCRKPKPGLMTQAAERYSIHLAESFLIGDRWRDVEAGSRAGCRTVWIDCGYAEQAPAVTPDARVESLAEAVHWIVNESEIESETGR